MGPQPAARAQAAGRPASATHRLTPWLVSTALFLLPLIVVSIGDIVDRRDLTHGEAMALFGLQIVGMGVGYAIAHFRKPSMPTIPAVALARTRNDAAAGGPASMEALLDLAEDALEPHAVALYLELGGVDESQPAFELRGTRPLDLSARRMLTGPRGIVQAVRRRSAQVSLKGTACNRDALGYYLSEAPVRHAVASPVWLGSTLAGVFVVDTLRPQGFSSKDLRIIQRIGHQLGGALRLEDVLRALSRDQASKERFYQASRAFALARTVEQVARITVDMARRISELDFAALVVHTEPPEESTRVAAADWRGHAELSAAWVGRACPINSIVGEVIASGRARSVEGETAATLWGGEATPLAFGHVFPLNWKNTTVGALVVGHSSAAALNEEALDLVTVLVDHAAVAISNALLFEQLELMATTDGLTGLCNQRQFHSLFETHIAAAERYGRQLSFILTDIDHFKAVNDRFGHPAGDAVLKQVANILQNTARRTDLVARYGGEEFAILMEETDRHGALQMAERIRRAVEAEALVSSEAQVRCTLSLGVATFPEDAIDKTQLIACADQALYQAKRAGRNQTVVFAATTPRAENSKGVH